MNAARPKPVYVPGYQPGGRGGRGFGQQGQSATPRGAGEAYIVGTGGCGTGSIPGSLEHRSTFTIVQSKDETLLIFGARGTQHIYNDGRAHPLTRLTSAA